MRKIYEMTGEELKAALQAELDKVFVQGDYTEAYDILKVSVHNSHMDVIAANRDGGWESGVVCAGYSFGEGSYIKAMDAIMFDDAQTWRGAFAEFWRKNGGVMESDPVCQNCRNMSWKITPEGDSGHCEKRDKPTGDFDSRGDFGTCEALHTK